jgi:hypothetical protein
MMMMMTTTAVMVVMTANAHGVSTHGFMSMRDVTVVA